MSTPFTVQQSENYEGENWWQWAVWLDGPEEELDKVESVQWKLHPTFPHRIRRSTDRGSMFRIETAGWGVFPIHVTVRMNDGLKFTLTHELSLHYPDGTTTTA